MNKLENLENKYLELGKEIEALKKEDGLPNSWEEYLDLKISKDFVTDLENEKEYYPNRYKALRKLELLRDCYNGDWEADWERDTNKHIIYFAKSELNTFTVGYSHHFLHFKTEELRDKFRENFSDIIMEAKELL